MFGFRRPILQKAIAAGARLQRGFSLRRDSFMGGDNAVYAEQMFEQWQKDPQSVHVSWHIYFSNLARGVDPAACFQEPPFNGLPPGAPGVEHQYTAGVGQVHIDGSSDFATQVRIIQMIDLYRRRGHLVADVDPLNIEDNRVHIDDPFFKLEANPELFDFTADSLNKSVKLAIKDKLFAEKSHWTPLEIAKKLERVYTGPIGFEYMHIPDRQAVQWIQDRIESADFRKQSKEAKANLLHRVAESQALSDILDKKYPSSKKYGAEGCDAGITGMEHLADVATEHGVSQIVVGMPHRGRFNVMTGMFKKSYGSLFTAFNDRGVEHELHADEWAYSSDVKYHMQANTTRVSRSGHKTMLVAFHDADSPAQPQPPRNGRPCRRRKGSGKARSAQRS